MDGCLLTAGRNHLMERAKANWWRLCSHWPQNGYRCLDVRQEPLCGSRPDADILYEASTVRVDNIVTILPETAPALYLEYLQKKGISYLFADASSYSHWLSIVCVLKGRLLKNLLVFLRKIEDLTFFHWSSPNRGKKGKNGLFRPRLTPSAKIGHVGVYFAKTGCKIEDGFTDIFGFQVMYLELDWRGRWGRSFISGLLIRFAAKRKMAETIFMAQPSLFLPSFWLYFNERIYEYGDKVKLMISWKSVDFKPQFWWKSVWKGAWFVGKSVTNSIYSLEKVYNH